MHPYQLKSSQSELNGEPVEGYDVCCNGEFRLFVNAFYYVWARVFINHINNAFDMLEMNNGNERYRIT